ncbi:hypothetical protein JXI42_11295 [bacterium]|nr:hypothetical protein [bacterium]
MSQRRKKHEGKDNFILMAILEDGPLGLKELEQKAILFISHFGHLSRDELGKNALGFFARLKADRRGEDKKKQEDLDKETFDVQVECNTLIEKGFLLLGDQGKYHLTSEGIAEAEESRKSMETMGGNYDFHEGFEALVKPLLAQEYLANNDDEFILTAKGSNFLNRIFRVQRYHENI